MKHTLVLIILTLILSSCFHGDKIEETTEVNNNVLSVDEIKNDIKKTEVSNKILEIPKVILSNKNDIISIPVNKNIIPSIWTISIINNDNSINNMNTNNSSTEKLLVNNRENISIDKNKDINEDYSELLNFSDNTGFSTNQDFVKLNTTIKSDIKFTDDKPDFLNTDNNTNQNLNTQWSFSK